MKTKDQLKKSVSRYQEVIKKIREDAAKLKKEKEKPTSGE